VAAVNPPETISDKYATVTPQTFEPQRPIFSGADAGEAKKPVKRRWLRGVVIGVSALIVVLVALAFLIPSGTRRVVHNPGRLELVLVADFAPNQTGAPLLNYRNTGKVYGIERDLTLPGDIDSVEETRDANGIPALEICLTDAAVKRMNSGASIVDHDMALVLDGRTIIAIARVRDPLGNALIISGNFSADDLNRLLDAIASSPQQKSENGRIPDSNSSGGTAPAPRGDQTVTTQSENVKSTPPEVREDHPPTARKNVVPKRVQQDESVAISSVIKQVQPIYPALALESHIEGQVRLNTIIDVDARVIEVKYLSGPAMLVPSAMDAVKKCRFKPTMLNGAPVQVESVIEVNFKLGG
jgi:TonB family protein